MCQSSCRANTNLYLFKVFRYFMMQAMRSQEHAASALEEQKAILMQLQKEESRTLDEHRSVKTSRQRLENDLMKIKAEVESARCDAHVYRSPCSRSS